MFDEFFRLASQIAGMLLPILGAILLIYVIILIRQLLKVLVRVESIVNEVDRDVKLLDAPLKTLLRVNTLVDEGVSAFEEGVKSMVLAMVKYSSQFTNWLKSVVEQTQEHSEDMKSEENQ